MAELYPLCLPLAPLLGTWRGRGQGSYPTIDDFAYAEELVGYLRALGDGAVELTVAQPSGVVEVDVGSATKTADGLVVELESAEVGLTPSAKSVTAVRRRLAVAGSALISELWMAAVGEADLVHHVRSELSRD